MYLGHLRLNTLLVASKSLLSPSLGLLNIRK